MALDRMQFQELYASYGPAVRARCRAICGNDADADEALQETFSTVGAAIVITSVALIAGFLVMATSGFAVNTHIGALTAIVIGFALAADLLFLPSVLLAKEGGQDDQD